MRKLVTLTLAGSLPLVLAACELAPKVSEQNGYRGTGMNHINVADGAELPEVPAPPYALPEDTGGPRANEVYENVPVLGNISADEFNYTMAAMTAWVSPDQGCNYCHNPANMASDELYTKVVARRMIQMTQFINAENSAHVGETGVTCYTCHGGNNIPVNYWSLPEDQSGSIAGNRHGQNNPLAAGVAYSSLPETAVAQYLLNGDSAAARVQTTAIHPGDNDLTTMDAEATYSMMVHMSESLGVNCTYCHNTGSFQSWSMSTPQRATAWHGIQMTGSVNEEYITPLAGDFPENRLGPLGDPYKVNCTTCHQGLNRPLGGAPMAADYPALWSVAPAPEPEAPAAPEVEDAN